MVDQIVRMRPIAAVILLFLLSGCLGSESMGYVGGSGGGGGGNAGTLPTPDPLGPKLPASDYESSADFDPCYVATDSNTYCNYGLGQIGASSVYADGASGSGVVVAVVDTGVITNHTELDANISPLSIDVVRDDTPIASGGTLTDEDGHGTFVSGVIAAERNDLLTHGVAFDATILAIRTDTRITDTTLCGSTDPTCSVFNISDVAAGIDYAAGKAHVINLSLGIPGTTISDTLGSSFETSLINAMGAGAIIVVAIGNESAAEPALPAGYAGDARVNASGQMIAVGAVDSTGTITSFSNNCGSAMDYCLMAPGDNIWSTYNNGSIALGSGTSFAAPYVSGSAALLIQLWPTLAPADVVSILLNSATDLGAAGVDPVYGHGLLNLQAALAPAGTLSVPLTASTAGDSVPLSGTSLSLGTAFGDALANSELLTRSFALDDYDRNYGVDLNDLVVHVPRRFGFDALVGLDTVKPVETELPNGMKLAMGVSEKDDSQSAAEWNGMAADEVESRSLHGMSLEVGGIDGTTFRLGYDVTPEQQVAGLLATDPASLFWMPGDTLGPDHSIVGAGTGISVSRQLGGSSVLSLGWVDQNNDPDLTQRDASLGEITLSHRFGNEATAYAGYSTVDERHGFMGSDAAGGFAVNGAETNFYSLGGRYPMGAGVELIGNYTLGTANMSADGSSLLSDWSEIRADAFGVGLVKHGLFGAGDRIGLLAGQPLRVSSGAATVTAPVGYLADKTVVQDSERVSMVPSGREFDLQLAYDSALGGAASISGWVIMQLEPGHVADAAPAYGAGIRFNAEF